MKRFWSILALLTAFVTIGFAQEDPQDNPNAQAIRESQQYCPNLFNPSQFAVQGPNPAKASWQGWAGGDGVSGSGGKEGQHASTCGNWDMTFPTGPATAAQIDAAQPNSSSSPANWIYYGNSGACGWGNTTQTENSHKRFKIMSAGMDPLTHNRLSQVPTDPDVTFSSSIRLGNHCGGGKQAEKLVYQFKVQPQNALLVLYYALSLEDARHHAAANPEFVIEVQIGNPGPNTSLANLNSYNYTPIGEKLFYGQPTPVQGGQLAPFMDGGSGTNGSEDNVYLPWNKVVINLGNYLNKPIRICIGTGDCAYSVHYAYSYIAGYCRPMKIIVDGCPIGSGDIVSTLHAPSGIEDSSYTTDPNYHAYQWYIASNTDIVGDQIDMTQATDDAWFAANFTPIPGATSSTYETNIGQFIVRDAQGNIDTIYNKRAFACEMTTFMNKTMNGNVRAYPIKSRLFADATNQKPQLQLDQFPACDGSIRLNSTSFCGTPNYMVDDSIKWTVFNNPALTGNSTIITGKEVLYQSDSAGTYYALMHIPTIDSSCYTEDTIEIHAIENPEAIITVSNEQPCLGDAIDLIDNSENTINRTWHFSDSTTSTDSTLTKSFTLANDTITLIVENEYEEMIGNDINNKRHCVDTAIKVINVFTSPELEVSDDTIVCEGQRTNVTVSVVDDDPDATYDYAWYRHLNRDGENAIQTGNILQQIPDAGSETSTYYVKVTRQPQGCEAWDSITVHVVRPTIKMKPADGKICPGEVVQLIAGNAHHYNWIANPEDQSLAGQDTKDTINVTPTATTTYTLIGHGSDDCNADPLTKTVTLFPTPIPEIEITPGFVDSEDPVVTFNDASQYGVSTKWDFGNGNTSTQRQTSYTFTDISHSESVTVKMTSFNELGTQAKSCHDSTSIDIPIQLFSVWVPNAFTPTLMDNNKFKLYTANILEYFSIQIFDRNGQLVFQSTDQRFEWDGTFNGAMCPQGAYVYIIKYRREGTPDITTRKGTLSLIR